VPAAVTYDVTSTRLTRRESRTRAPILALLRGAFAKFRLASVQAALLVARTDTWELRPVGDFSVSTADSIRPPSLSRRAGTTNLR
jgi:hypothetical protein